jgi:hypothetical protein
MKTLKGILTLATVSAIIFGFSLTDDIIKGWFNSGSVQTSYKTVLDNTVFQNGHKSVRIESLDTTIQGFATVMQFCSAKDYLGTRVKLTGYIKSENVKEWSGMWFRIDSKEGHESLGFDNMQDRPITGTTDWTKCEIILEVPENSGTLNFGALIAGTGKIWFDNVTLEILDNKSLVKSDDQVDARIPLKPVNLDFEE